MGLLTERPWTPTPPVWLCVTGLSVGKSILDGKQPLESQEERKCIVGSRRETGVTELLRYREKALYGPNFQQSTKWILHLCWTARIMWAEGCRLVRAVPSILWALKYLFHA